MLRWKLWKFICSGLLLVAAIILASLLIEGRISGRSIIAGDQTSPIDNLRSFAEEGIPHAQFLLGFAYLSGQGVTKNPGIAIAWLKKAADQGDREAQYFVGQIYERGLGVEKNPTEAARWYRMAADRGQAAAQISLAGMYQSGSGVARDNAIAMRWYFRAAGQGIAAAQIALAKLFAETPGTEKDDQLSYQWASIAQAKATTRAELDEVATVKRSAAAALSGDQMASAKDQALQWRPVLEAWPELWPLAIKEQLGVRASMAIEAGQVAIRWRSLRAPITNFTDVAVTMDRHSLGVAKIEPYSGGTSAFLLFDASDPSRTSQIQSERESLIAVAGKISQRHEIDVGAYGERLEILNLQDSSIQSVTDAVNSVSPLAPRANLGDVLRNALQIPPLSSTERHGIFVFTDGHADDALDTAALAAMAKDDRTSITFIIGHGDRPINLESLVDLARETGGELVTEFDLPLFLNAPFALLDSGGSARVPMPLGARMIWAANPKVDVDLRNDFNRDEFDCLCASASGRHELDISGVVVEEFHRNRCLNGRARLLPIHSAPSPDVCSKAARSQRGA